MISAEELQRAQAGTEISEEELEDVAGGGGLLGIGFAGGAGYGCGASVNNGGTICTG